MMNGQGHGAHGPDTPVRGRVAAALGRFAARTLDVLLPPQCLRCGAMVDAPGVLCAPCWERIVFLGPPECDSCGLPFEYDAGEGALCGACARQRPPYRRARAAMVYDDASRRLVLAFKHGDRTDTAPAFGRWLVRAGGDLIADADVVAPVPLHWTRLFARRYNQAALLGHAVGRLAGIGGVCHRAQVDGVAVAGQRHEATSTVAGVALDHLKAQELVEGHGSLDVSYREVDVPYPLQLDGHVYPPM